MHIQHIENDKWLQIQCKNPDFFSRMRHHTSICEKVGSLHQPAFIVGLQASIPAELKEMMINLDFMPGWHVFFPIASCILVIVTNVLLPIYKAREDRIEQNRILQACNPIQNWMNDNSKKRNINSYVGNII